MQRGTTSAGLKRRALLTVLALLLAVQLIPLSSFIDTANAASEQESTVSEDAASIQDSSLPEDNGSTNSDGAGEVVGEGSTEVGEEATVPSEGTEAVDSSGATPTEQQAGNASSETSEEQALPTESNTIDLQQLHSAGIDVMGVDWSYTHETSSLRLLSSTNYALLGSAPIRVVAASGIEASITLQQVTIDLSNAFGAPMDFTDASISLFIQGANVFKAGGTSAAGIMVPEGATLTVQGPGSLEAHGALGGAGIGGAGTGSEGEAGNSGSIAIYGGMITAVGGTGAAGIGGGAYGTADTILLPAYGVAATAGAATSNCMAGAPVGSGGTATTAGTAFIGMSYISYTDGTVSIALSYPSASVTLPSGAALRSFASTFAGGEGLKWIAADGQLAYDQGAVYTAEVWPSKTELRLGSLEELVPQLGGEETADTTDSMQPVEDMQRVLPAAVATPLSDILLPLDDLLPVLSEGSATRISSSEATISFSATAAGQFYYAVVDAGGAVPVINTATKGTYFYEGTQSFTITGLSSDAKDIYIRAKGHDGQLSEDLLKVSLRAAVPVPVLTAGEAIRYNAQSGTVSFTSTVAGEYHYELVSYGEEAPALDMEDTGLACAAGLNTFELNDLATGVYEVYIVARNTDGEVSDEPLRMTLLMPRVADESQAQSSGSFMAAALAEGELIAAPERIAYQEGDTLAAALARSATNYVGLEENSVVSVEGHAGTFESWGQSSILSTAEQLALNTSPEALEGGLLLFVEGGADTPQIPRAAIELAEEMLRYNGSALAQKYSKASSAYTAAFQSFQTLLADAQSCMRTADELRNAIDEAEAQLDNASATVNFEVLLGGEELNLNSVEIWVEYPAYGSSHLVENSAISLPEGSYTYTIIYAAESKQATGSFEVADDDLDIVANFPEEAQWLSHLRLNHQTQHPLIYEPRGNFFDEDLNSYATSSLLSDFENSGNDIMRITATLVNGFAQKYSGTAIWFYGNANVRMTSGTALNVTNLNRLVYSSWGAASNFSIEVVYTDTSTGIRYAQTYKHTIERARSVASVEITDGRNTLLSKTESNILSSTGANTIDGTQVVVSMDTSQVVVNATATTSYNQGNYILINDEEVKDGTATVPLNTNSDTTDIRLQARNVDGSYGEVVTITVVKKQADITQIKVDDDTTLVLTNASGYEVAASQITQEGQEGTTVHSYALIEGQSYSYTASKGSYYRVTGTFVAGSGASVIEPEFNLQDYLASFNLSLLGETMYQQEAPVQKESLLRISDGVSDPGDNSYTAQVVLSNEAPEDVRLSLVYNYGGNSQGNLRTVVLPTDGSTAQLIGLTGQTTGTRVELIVESTNAKGETVQQIYVLNIQRILTLQEGSIPVFTVEGWKYASDPHQIQAGLYDYDAVIPVGTSEALMNVAVTAKDGITATVNGTGAVPTNNKLSLTLPFEGTRDETIEIVLSSSDGTRNTYLFTVKPRDPVTVTFSYEPEEAFFHLYSKLGQEILPNEDGTYTLTKEAVYRYTLVLNGYITINEEFVASEESIHLAMEEVVPNEDIDPNVGADWSSFRGENNNAITQTLTPTSPEDTIAYWYTKTGGQSNIGQVIFVNGYLVTTAVSGEAKTTEDGSSESSGTSEGENRYDTGEAGIEFLYTDGYNRIIMLDPISGKVVAEGITMGPSGVIPTYAEGKLFVTGTGSVQAFNATPRQQTEEEQAAGMYSEGVMVLDSLWYYSDPLGGAPFTAIYYEDGYLYANWYNTTDSALVCLTAIDEKAYETHEAKVPVWRWVRSIGFYWAGACVNNGVVVVGGDEDPLGVVSLDAATGEVLDWIEDTGSVRCSISYDEATDRYYFTSKEGYFYSVGIDGEGQFYDVQRLSLATTVNQGELKGISTSTPVVYNGRAYIGIQGAGESLAAYKGHHLVVIDLESFTIAYKVETKGYAQSSGLVSTAYLDVPHLNPQTGENETGFVYVYFIENVDPARVSYLIDKPGLTEPLMTVEEVNGGITYTFAPLLFATNGVNGQFCLASCTVDAYGTMYIKTDKGQILAVGSRITELEVVVEPTKTVYEEGTKFDPSGVQIVAHYANGFTRDVTDYMMYPNEDAPLEYGENSVFALFPYSLYNDETPNAQLDPSGEAVYAGLDLQMNKLARPTINININVISRDETLTVYEVEDAIDAIGEVVLELSQDAITSARDLYDALGIDPKLQKAVTNYDVLLAAEDRYQYLEQLSRGVVPFSEVLTEENEVSISTSGTARFVSTEEELLSLVSATLAEAIAVEDGEPVSFFLETERIDTLTSTEEASLDAIVQEQNLVKTPVVYVVSLYKQVGDGEKVKVSSLIGTSKIQVEFVVPLEQQSYGRVFKMVAFQTVGAQVLSDLAVGQGSLVVCNINAFTTFALAYVKADGQVIDGSGTPGGNVIVGGVASSGGLFSDALGTASAGGVASNVSLTGDTEAEELVATTGVAIVGSQDDDRAGESIAVLDDAEIPLAAGRVAGENLAIVFAALAAGSAVALAALVLYRIIKGRRKTTNEG